MKNTVTITIPFSFKGVEHKPSSIIDLDNYVKNYQNFHSVFHLVATENKIDNYSYEYEVLESSQVIISHPTGIAADFLTDNAFDFDAFKQRIADTQVLSTLQEIAKQTLNIQALEDNEEIKTALLKAYEAGKEDCN